MSFKNYRQLLNEVQIQFNRNRNVNFGNIVILAGGAGCFEANTLVKTSEGDKKISEIVPGDKVYAFNEDTNTEELREVLELKENSPIGKELVKVMLENGDSFVCTSDHQFLIDGEWTTAKQGLVCVQIKHVLDVVYDLHVEGIHNYKLSNGLIAHNSGKGFVLETLLGIQGKVFDVDALKQAILDYDSLTQLVKDKYGHDVSGFDLKKPEHVSKLHEIVADEMNLPNKHQETFFKSVVTAHPDRKPNMIFDVTLKDMKKFDKITSNAKKLGYDVKKIHLVWVVNDVEVAKKQNHSRERVVPEDILVKTHEGVAMTIPQLLDMHSGIRKDLDGDIFFAFNKINVDSDVEFSPNGGMNIKKADYIQMKEVGKNPKSLKDVADETIRKISSYIPKYSPT